MANGQTGGAGSSGIADGAIVNGAGGDADILAGIAGGIATLRSLKAGTNMTLTEEAGDILLDAAGGGGGGLSQGEINQLFAASPSVHCSTTPVNAGSITATVSVSGGNATLTCSADCRAYIKPYSVVGTAAQTGKGALVASISGDGLTITCQGIGEDNPLVTDAVASQLKLYGAPVALVGNLTGGVTSLIYSTTTDGTVHIEGHGYWTGPMFNAGEWVQFGGTIGGYRITSAGGLDRIKSITSHALIVGNIPSRTRLVLADNTANQVVASVNMTTYSGYIIGLSLCKNDGTNEADYVEYAYRFNGTSSADGNNIVNLDGGSAGCTLSVNITGGVHQFRVTTGNTGYSVIAGVYIDTFPR